jgi:FAD/FMN-containing dehydrogenase
MEAAPRVLELRGDDVQKAIHAYGTTGVVTEVEMALAPAYGWVDFALAFDDFAVATRFCHALGCQDAMLKKLASLVAAPIAHRFFRPLQGAVSEHQHVVLTMIAPLALEAFADFIAGWPATVVYRSDTAGTAPLPPIYEFAWNHTTMHALRADKAITYWQIYYPAPDHVAKAIRMHERLAGDVMHHLEFVRFDGQIACFGLPLIRYSTAARLSEIGRMFEDEGCTTFDPHTVTLEEGGMKRVDRAQLAFKRETDPLGLLNPGKMIAWDDPDYDAKQDRLHLFPTTDGAPR